MDISDGFVSACGSGNIDIVKKLLELNKKILRDKFIEAIYCACIAGQLEIFKFLLNIRPESLDIESVYQKAYVNGLFSGNIELVEEIRKYEK